MCSLHNFKRESTFSYWLVDHFFLLSSLNRFLLTESSRIFSLSQSSSKVSNLKGTHCYMHAVKLPKAFALSPFRPPFSTLFENVLKTSLRVFHLLSHLFPSFLLTLCSFISHLPIRHYQPSLQIRAACPLVNHV